MLFKDLSEEIIFKSIAYERIDLKKQLDKLNDKLLDFYENRQLQDEYINFGFKRKDGSYDFPLVTYNVTKKIIDKISLVYKYAPERTLDKGDDIYQQWINDNPEFNLAMKSAERYKNLLHRILFRPHYVQDTEKWVFFIETYYEAHFLEGDPLHPVAYSYPIKQETTNIANIKDDWWVFWSDEFHFEFVPGTDKKRTAGELNDFNNPFKKMALVELRDSFVVNQYETSGAVDLVQANQAINVALNDLNIMVHYQAFDQVYATGVNEEEGKGIVVGPRKIILIGAEESNLGLLNFDPKIIDSIEAIKFQMKSIAQMYNLNMEVSLDKTGPVSGFSLLVQNIDLLEAREDDVEVAAVGEKQIYDVIASMQGYYGLNPRLPEDAKLSVDFQEMEFPVNQKEELERWDWEIDHNIVTPIDYMQSKNTDMDDEEALEKYSKNKEINGKMTARDRLKQTIQEAGGEIIPGQEPPA